MCNSLAKSALLFLFATANLMQGHFVFVAPDATGTSARVFMSENLVPELGTTMIAGTKLRLLGSDQPLALEPASKTFFSVPMAGTGTRVVFGEANLGVMKRGEGKAHLLIYYPKGITGDAFSEKTQLGTAVPVEIVPTGKPGAMKLKLVARGKAQANAEITVILPDGTEKKAKTDANGETEVLALTGRYGAWGRYFEAVGGEQAGKAFEETRHYATLVFDAGAPAGFTKLPQGTSSFGAATLDGFLYVYGGHVSPTHSYYKEAVSGRFDRVNLKGTPVWESLPAGPPMQGMNLIAHKGKLYRVGGMAPRNEKGQPSDIHSMANVARFDPKTKEWESLPNLPEPRSSHDFVVMGDQLYVTGGWTLAGKEEKWSETMLVMDLGKTPLQWQSVPQPFKKRALMAVALDGKMYVIGGIDDKSAVGRQVAVYEAATQKWSDGPELPKGVLLGFAPAAGIHHGELYVSLMDGGLLKMDRTKNTWEKVGKTTPRVAHRLVSRDETVLLIGGAAKGENLDLVEAVTLN